MSAFEMVRQQLGAAVPFASHVGLEITDLGKGTAVAELDDHAHTKNHIATQHAGALFTLAEAASGAAMAGAFLERLAKIRPVAAKASIEYIALAKGMITAEATVSDNPDYLIAELDEVGKIQFDVNVSLRDDAGEEVARVTVAWHVKSVE
ncbi:MAG: DUF4442 domain-containing protein [Pseudomonadota bacterium]